MQVRSMELGALSGHETGLRLLEQMYRQKTGLPMPNILRTDRGKPYFAEGNMHFSISHTKRRAFCVLSDKPVGIDAEETDRQADRRLADKILSESERQQYEKAEDKRRALLQFWVLKEAFVKCTGEGLQGYPKHTDFSLDDPRLQEMDGCFVAVIEEDKNAV